MSEGDPSPPSEENGSSIKDPVIQRLLEALLVDDAGFGVDSVSGLARVERTEEQAEQEDFS